MRAVILSCLIAVSAPAICRAQAGSAAAQAPPQAPAASVPAAPAQPAARPDPLPVRRVVLYKNGIGYFEHLGRVRGNQAVTIDFTSGQLNDVLKSMTTLDLGGGRITGITYNSEAPLSQQLSAVGLPLGEVTDVMQFFSALRGARLEARTPGGLFTGRLLAVERRQKTRTGSDQVEPFDVLAIATDAGEIRLVELTPGVSVRLADRDLQQQVGRYLGIVGSATQQAMRRMTLTTAGTGERPLFVSYVSEVPVWKTTYRLVVPSKPGAKPFLQGWAIVDNTVGEDWSAVEMSLVAGAPQSFIQQISQPYYLRRPVVPLPQAAQLEPQTHEATITVTGEAPLASPTMRPGVAGGVAGGVVGGLPMAPPPPPAASRYDKAESVEVSDVMRAQASSASGREMGDLFEYRIKEPVTIRKNQSAMVPILNSEVAIEKVTVWNPSGRNAVPLRGVWLTNSTGLTLDGGSFTVLESDAFAGEGLTDALKPGEKRLLSYAADTAVRVDAKTDGGPRRVEKVRISRGVIIQVAQDQERRVYTVRNEDTAPRTVIVEHPARPGWTLAPGGVQPVETAVGVNRFRLSIDAKKTATLTVDEVFPREVRYTLSRMTDNELAVFLRGPGIDPAIEAALKPIAEKKQAIAAIDRDLAARKAETTRIGTDQERVRENMKALKGSAEEKALVQRYARQLDEQENRLEALRKETTDLEQQRAKAQAELDRLIDALSFG
jgi:hypothetical protein